MSDHTDSVWYNEHIRRWVRQDPDGSAGFVVISGECDAPKPVTYSDTVEPDVFKRLANILTHDSTTPGSYVSVSLFEIGEILTAVRTLEAEVERLKGERDWWKGECNTYEGVAEQALAKCALMEKENERFKKALNKTVIDALPSESAGGKS